MATKTIDYLGFRMDVTPYEHEGNTFNRLSVSVGYQKGRGFYVTLHPVLADGGELYDFSRNPLSDTTWIDVEQATKNNSKRLTAIYENVKQGQEAVRLCFDARKWERMEFIIVNLAAHGYADWLKEDVGKFFETTSDNNQNNSEDEVMTNETMKVTDLIGKSVCNGNAKYVIKSINGDKVTVDFAMGDNAAKEMNMKAEQIEKLLQGGWTVSDEKKADGGSQKAEEPKAKTVKMTSEREQSGTRSGSAERESSRPQGKMEPEPKPKAEQQEKVSSDKFQDSSFKIQVSKPETCNVKPETKTGKLVYSVYTNKKGKTCAKISGFSETDAAYQQAVSLHGSATYENTKQGRVNFLLFGPHYAEVAKTVCQMLNEGKAVADCQAVVDAATEERHQKREEWKQKREAYRQEHEGRNHQPSDVIAGHTQTFGSENHQPSSGKTYTEAEVADLMRRVIEGDKEAIAIVNAMAA